MKNFTAIYREEKNASLKDTVRQYKTKAAFAADLRGSGLRVIAVLADADIKKYQEMSETEAILKGGNAEVVREYCQQVL